MRKISLFDFDGTLTTGDTFLRFIAFARGKMVLYTSLMKSLPSILKWKLGYISNGKAKEKLFAYAFKGMNYVKFCQKGEEFIETIKNMERTPIVDKMKDAIATGEEVIIVTASMEEWIKPWATQCGVKEILSTRPEIDNAGKLTGRFTSPNCHGDEKERRIMELLPDLASHRADYFITAYGDSSGDDAMLRLADKKFRI